MLTVNNTTQKKIEDFFFAEKDVSILCIFRFLIGGICVFNSLAYILSFNFFYSENAILSLELFSQRYTHGFSNLFNLFYQLGIGSSFLGYLSLIFSILLFIGLRTRTAAFGCFLLVQAFSLRNPLAVFGLDDLLRNFLFILTFSSCGALYSVDSIVAKRQGKPLKTTAPAWPLRLLQIQLSVVYAMTFISKLTNGTWRDGTALYYIVRINELRRFTVPWIFDQLWAIKLVTWSVLMIELALTFGLWVKKYRNILISIGILFHFCIDITMNLPLFQYLMIAGLICFYESKKPLQTSP